MALRSSGTPPDDAPPRCCQIALRWTARLCAVTAVALFALVLVAIHLERTLHASTATVVDTFRINNGYFDDRVDFDQVGRLRDEALELRRTLEEISTVTAEDVGLLESIVPDAARLLAAANTDLEIARELSSIADTLNATAADIRDSAEQADTTVTAAQAQLGTIAELVEQLNHRLAEIDRKLVLPRAPASPPLDKRADPRLELPGVLPR